CQQSREETAMPFLTFFASSCWLQVLGFPTLLCDTPSQAPRTRAAKPKSILSSSFRRDGRFEQKRWPYPGAEPNRSMKTRKFGRRPPRGFVALEQFIPSIRLQIRYHTQYNFTHAPLPGYGSPAAWMLRRAAIALRCVQRRAKRKGLGLLVYDAYRPKRGTLAMVAWAKRTRQKHLLRGYIATRSGHNHGHTVDLTLVNLRTGRPLFMGNAFDTLDRSSHTRRAKGLALKHRLLLTRLMRSAGFRPYSKEWWHFRYPMRRTRPRDVPYSCFEAPEYRWKAPKGWSNPGFVMPTQWRPKPCPKSSP
ncbi:MAG: M15 family metallopeptidase, partial [Myxococcota bacterium]